MRLYEHLCYTGRVVRFMVLMPLYGLNLIVSMMSNRLEICLIRHLVASQIADQYSEDLSMARSKLNRDLKELYFGTSEQQFERLPSKSSAP